MRCILSSVWPALNSLQESKSREQLEVQRGVRCFVARSSVVRKLGFSSVRAPANLLRDLVTQTAETH